MTAIDSKIVGAGTGHITAECGACPARHRFEGDWTAEDVKRAVEIGGPQCPATGAVLRLVGNGNPITATGTGLSAMTSPRSGKSKSGMASWWAGRYLEKSEWKHRSVNEGA